MPSQFFPIFSAMRIADDGATVQIQQKRTGDFVNLKSFNGIDAGRLLALAIRDQTGETPSAETLRLNIGDYAIKLRLEDGGTSAAASGDDDSDSKPAHVGFRAVIQRASADTNKNAAAAAAPERKIKLVAIRNAGIAEKKALLVNIFANALTLGARLGLTPQQIGEAFAVACPDEEQAANPMGDVGNAMGNMMGNMMGGLMGAVGGAAGGGGGAGPECKQQ